eukprot:m.121135 g.121135  ORF g.121135 m.121135 type:complete len:77 (+) comp17268_c0_seq2:1074-1304(+)
MRQSSITCVVHNAYQDAKFSVGTFKSSKEKITYERCYFGTLGVQRIPEQRDYQPPMGTEIHSGTTGVLRCAVCNGS